MKAMQEEIKKKTQDRLKTFIDGLFLAFPWFGAITWTQYTPYWNDGDECTFGVNDIYVIPNNHTYLERFEDGDYPEECTIDTHDYRQKVYELENKSGAELALSSEYKWDVTKYNPTMRQSIYDSGQHRRSIEKYKDMIIYQEAAEEFLKEYNIGIDTYNTSEKAIYDFFNSFGDDLMKDIFGDHVQVKITRKGLEVEEYDHD